MSDKLITLLDSAKLRDNDEAVGMIEEVNVVAPELDSLLGRTIKGVTYKVVKRLANPKNAEGTATAFRNANEGTDLLSSRYSNDLGQCFFLDGQLQVDEMIVKERQAEGDEFADILAAEGAALMQDKVIQLGDQFYRGQSADAKGFVGLQSLYDTANCEVNATGNSGSACSVYLVFNDLKGVHWVWGNGGGLEMGNWTRQQVTDANGKKLFAWVNNCTGFIGLGFGHSRSVVRIKNLTTAAGKGFTDALVAEALAKMPIVMRNQKSKLKLFVNSVAALQLQKSRSTVSSAKTDSGVLQFAPDPKESNGVEIVLTDSLPNNE